MISYMPITNLAIITPMAFSPPSSRLTSYYTGPVPEKSALTPTSAILSCSPRPNSFPRTGPAISALWAMNARKSVYMLPLRFWLVKTVKLAPSGTSIQHVAVRTCVLSSSMIYSFSACEMQASPRLVTTASFTPPIESQYGASITNRLMRTFIGMSETSTVKDSGARRELNMIVVSLQLVWTGREREDIFFVDDEKRTEVMLCRERI